MSTAHLSPMQPTQRRPSSFRQGPPLPCLAGDSRGRASPGGLDVTPTSPSGGSSLVSIRPLPPPTLFQPPPLPLDRNSSVSSRTSYSTCSMPPASPVSVVANEPPSTASGKGKSSSGAKVKENTGRWQAEEHEVFLKGLNEHGKQWKKIAIMIKTRSVVQVRTHAQKYFQKLLKNKKDDGRHGKERSASILSTSTAASISTATKRKSSTKGNKTTAAAVSAVKKRRVSLEPKPKKQHMVTADHHAVHHVHHQLPPPPQLMASAPPMPFAPPAPTVDHTVIDPSFMHALNMSEGDLDDSLLDLLDDSSVEAVEHVIGSDDDLDLDLDLEPNKIEPNPVSPSVSSMSLADSAGSVVYPTPTAELMVNRHDIVSSPNPEDFSIHNTIGTSSISGRELSPTSVACMMDIKDFEQKTSGYVDALDWLMDVGVHQLPATAGEAEEDWARGHTSSLVVPKLSHSKLAQVNSSALSVLDGDVF